MTAKSLRAAVVLFATVLLAGCQKFTVLVPSGYIALQQRNMLVASVVLMCFVMIPVFVATIIFAIRYRQNNRKSTYAPDWEHSLKIELMVWGGPLLIVVILGVMTWIGCHRLDPMSKLTRIDHNTRVAEVAEHVKPLTVKAISTQWKWLFLYPQYDIATVGAMAAPVNVPINFDITSSDVMNSFYIPALAGQIYAMPGMKTELNAVINATGTYKGISANFSGAGYPYMDFQFKAMKEQQFQQWVAKIQNSGGSLTKARYQKLAEPSIAKSVKTFANYADGLYKSIVLRCFHNSARCQEFRHRAHNQSAPGMEGMPEMHETSAHRKTTEAARQTVVEATPSH